MPTLPKLSENEYGVSKRGNKRGNSMMSQVIIFLNTAHLDG
jgi:hypothetical protein